MKAILAAYIDDLHKNQLLRDLGVASLFFIVAILLQSTRFYMNQDFQTWIGASTGFALGYAIRSIIVMRSKQREL